MLSRKRDWVMLAMATSLLTVLAAVCAVPQSGKYFQITIVDEQTGRGVPLVELQTVNNIRLYTDSNGIVAFHEPCLMGQRVFFHISSHGYEFPKDGFGYRGKALDVTEGGRDRLAIKRINIAERLYRITGGGIYRDSLLIGRPVPTKHPVLNALVFGSDSVATTVYRGKLYWFWGDTNQPAYPLGNFHVPGATSLLPGRGGLDPETGIDLCYFTDENGFAKPTAPLPGKGPTWISGLVALREGNGRERLFASYVKVRGFLDVYERGLVEFNDEKQQFEKVAQFRMDAAAYPGGHPFRRVVDGVEYIYFANPYALIRVRADPAHLKDLASYESFTCLKAGSRLGEDRLDRGEEGGIRYAWKRNTPPVGPVEQAKLIRSRLLQPEEALLHLQDADTGNSVTAHSGSVAWNAYRRRWVMITAESSGTSPLGEVWYAEADAPLGPWVYARKIVTHDKYSFYNPKQHPAFDKEMGRLIFFEGTFSHTFSGNPHPTPRYDYNQILYKLDLSDPRLVLPVPVYQSPDQGEGSRFLVSPRLAAEGKGQRVAFFALDRPAKGTTPVYEWPAGSGGGTLRLIAPPRPPGGLKAEPLFHALPVETKEPPATAVPLYQFVHQDDRRYAYTTDPGWSKPGYQRSRPPLCLVWRTPARLVLPRD